ncbi:MAG: bifunctional DNA-formamidopyrimidine glycosylase/DNA-(apurinic or apyrimidinic site) lyase [Gemmatimonadota bacterium]|nr:bifunctional DNA-formamidopyrimidine glycosylase/DNA-(apurinic or apyrimidinic site) lyase [Gemmatimonadota bacterium]
MPELPEVETIVRDLAPRVSGRTIRHPRLHKSDVLRGVTRRTFLAGITGRRIDSLSRRAKHLIFLLDSGRRMVIQLRMTGSLLVKRGRLTAEQERYAVLTAPLGGRETLVFQDVRRLGTIHLLDEPAWGTYTARIGAEPLDPGFDAAQFAAVLRGSSQAVKKVIMDQRKLAGVGNIYANEALFRAGIDPSRRADRIAEPAAAQLHAAVRAVLTEAIDARGTTVRDYRTGTGQRGGFQFSLDVYDRAGEPCVRCGTLLATTHAIDGRQTTFCWHCQGAEPSGGPRRGR